MSTTNPPPGTPIPPSAAPGAGPAWPADALNARAPDDHAGGGGVTAEALRLRHEPDAYAVKPIMSIPFAVVVTFLIAFSVAAAVFTYVMARGQKPSPLAHPEGLARGKAALAERLARIDQDGASGVKSEVDAPRLEPLQRLAKHKDEKDYQFTTQLPVKKGNSPWIHPEDIRPDRVAALQRAEYLDKDKKTARIPIGDAMKLVVEKGMLPAAATGSRPQPTDARPTGANGGTGGLPVPAKAAAPAPKAEPAKGPMPAPLPPPAPPKK